ncbi:metalloregulator ArsR/SmtB family transcription factor [Pseudarthrobacter defluvii]|uniref:metalloregulator ArsR/SmtB family transcription factor n=1 Tax=Pseudarthrobacter defluvii TaxID=410837 RepID=UPI0027D8D0AB|nr:metalloregulator ArsR/SmtB family transcription factor [Pseudarthrobacter defluvii]
MSHQGMTDRMPAEGSAPTSMSAAAEIFKAVAHPVRAQILDLLRQGECSIPQLCEGTGVKASHLSRHLMQMRSQRLIQCQRSGGQLFYRLAVPEAAELLAAARAVLRAQVAGAATRSYSSRRSLVAGPPSSADVFPAPGDGTMTPPTFSEEQFAALESTLASRAVIADACQAIAARTGCTVDAAGKQLILAAHNGNITLRDAAARELQNGHRNP